MRKDVSREQLFSHHRCSPFYYLRITILLYSLTYLEISFNIANFRIEKLKYVWRYCEMEDKLNSVLEYLDVLKQGQDRLEKNQTGRSEERRVGKECRSRWWPERREGDEKHIARHGGSGQPDQE